ncbi:hypothetical protein [Pararhizobium sp.]|uniref:hypothetical protein n=1 Tax=Pararhizobium sp. TaxID=1977563 RepID=UPI0039C91905
MLPIIRDPFWSPLAFTVIGGLVVAAALTLIFLPALYVLWFRIPADPEPARDEAVCRTPWPLAAKGKGLRTIPPPPQIDHGDPV